MRVVLVRRGRPGVVRLHDGVELSPDHIDRVLDDADVPDATPFLIDPQHGLRGLDHVNQYLLEASRQRAYTPDNLRDHAYALRRALIYLRDQREQLVDLTAISRQELRVYKEHRRTQLKGTSWNDEVGRIGSFLRYAADAGWIDQDPTPRWGQRQRNTLLERETAHRRERFLTEPQARLFLTAGLRGDPPAPPELLPSYPNRDYAMGLLMLSTGTRREEAAYILDCEIPRASQMPSNGIYTFTRYGKNSRPRDVWVTDHVVDQLDLYRDTERRRLVHRAQPSLRRALRQGTLLLVDDLQADNRGRPQLLIHGHRTAPERLDNQQRRQAVLRRDDGTLEPLCLFLVEGGTGPALRTINHVFSDATARLATFEHPDHAPEHLDITPHVLRHTFAVRMLATLMQVGRNRTGDPYQLLASPVFVVQQLLGHADVSTTQRYLFAAERYVSDLPLALRNAAESIASSAGTR